jgi:hypothetical protein
VSTSFTRTREQLRSMVLRKLGVVGAATSVVSADADIVYEAIDLRLKEMHRLGVFWLKMTVTDGSTDEPVEIIGKPEYAAIELKNDSGLPTKAIWKGSTEFILHPVPITSSTVKLVYEKIADDTTAGSAADVDVSMMRHLKDIIAYDVGDDFGMDEGRMQRFQREAMMAEKNIRKLNAERKNYGPVCVDEYPDEQQTYWD